MEKKCLKCNLILDLGMFYKRKNGLASYCKKCSYLRDKSSKRQEYFKNYMKGVKRRNWMRKYYNNKMRTDLQFKLETNLRIRINKAIKYNQKAGSAVRDLGCTIPEFKIYIENQFERGMSWDNYGYKTWHIDHRKALKNFNLTDREQFKQAVHYTNLQPLWAVDNFKKSGK